MAMCLRWYAVIHTVRRVSLFAGIVSFHLVSKVGRAWIGPRHLQQLMLERILSLCPTKLRTQTWHAVVVRRAVTVSARTCSIKCAMSQLCQQRLHSCCLSQRGVLRACCPGPA